jgi:hypothetical protein
MLIMLFRLPVLPFIPPIMPFKLLAALKPFIMLPMGTPAPGVLVKVEVVAMLGCGVRVESPAPGGGLRAKPEEPKPVAGFVVGGGGSENEEVEVVLVWPIVGR